PSTATIMFFVLHLTHTTPTDIYPLSLHDALPISRRSAIGTVPTNSRNFPRAVHDHCGARSPETAFESGDGCSTTSRTKVPAPPRSEEHTSELQSRENLVCRLLLEKKKKHK